jgi:hypothetical protein
MIEEKTTKLPRGAISKDNTPLTLDKEEQEEEKKDKEKTIFIDNTLVNANKVLIEWGSDGQVRFNINNKMQTLEEHIHEILEKEISKIKSKR